MALRVLIPLTIVLLWKTAPAALISRAHTPSGALSLPAVARPRSCGRTDVDCLNLKAVEITNEIRARHGAAGNLVPGPAVMLDNAKKWSKFQMGAGMQHQSPLPALGCGIQINKENVAMFGGMDRDPAEQCMKQWEGSSGHLRNIKNAKAGDYVTIGIDIQGDTTYCTQTFAAPPSSGGGGQNCAPGSDVGGGQPGGGDSKQNDAVKPSNEGDSPGAAKPPSANDDRPSSAGRDGQPKQKDDGMPANGGGSPTGTMPPSGSDGPRPATNAGPSTPGGSRGSGAPGMHGGSADCRDSTRRNGKAPKSDTAPSMRDDKDPSMRDDKDPSMRDDKDPSMGGDNDPSMSGDKDPSMSGGKGNSMSGDTAPSMSGDMTPSMDGDMAASMDNWASYMNGKY